MDRSDKIRLLFSIALSFLIWGLLVNWKFSLLVIPAILFHEYGHYHWMGREGIKQRSMIMIPPFGAMAIAKEPWPSRAAETRIALAGPVFGFFSALVAYVFWQLLGYSVLETAVSLICFINMFNLVPIPILDGGRVIKSILFSISNELGFAFYIFGFAVLFGAFLFVPSVGLISLFVGFMLYQDFKFYCLSPKTLADKNVELWTQPLKMGLGAMVSHGLFYVGLILAYFLLSATLSKNPLNFFTSPTPF